MSVPVSELSRMVKVKGLPAEPIVVEADAVERAALAARFGLASVESLRAEVSLEQRPRAIRASGRLSAAFMQCCAISGEDFPVTVDEPIDLRFVEAGAAEAVELEELELEADDCDEIDYAGDAFDLGEAIAQTLGLAIDPYAEGPEADAARKREGISREGEEEGPLAEMLKGLAKGQ